MIYWRRDAQIIDIFFSLLYKTDEFHVAVYLFSNRSKMTSKCDKNISDTLFVVAFAEQTCVLLMHPLVCFPRPKVCTIFLEHYLLFSNNKY